MDSQKKKKRKKKNPNIYPADRISGEKNKILSGFFGSDLAKCRTLVMTKRQSKVNHL